MSNPVDIKIAHINKNENTSKSINKDLVHEVFQRYINDKLKSFYRLQQDWVNRAYKNFNDFDTYLILMYLMNKVYVNYSDRFHYMSMEAFYSQDKVGIEKIKIISLASRYSKPPNPICICGKRTHSSGKNSKYRCNSCGEKYDRPSLINESPNLELDWFEPPASSRRHLTKPIKLMR